MSTTKTSSAGRLSVECLWPGDTAPVGWLDEAEEVFKKSGQTDVFQQSFMPPDAVTANNFHFYKLLLTAFREFQEIRSARTGDRLAGVLITRSPGQRKLLSEADSVKEDKHFIGQYSGDAADLSDRLCTLEEALTNFLSGKGSRDFKEATEIVGLAIDPDHNSYNPGSALLNDLDAEQDYKVCVVERSDKTPATDGSDPSTVAFYTTRGFVKQGSYTVWIPETEWVPEDTKALATWLMKPRAAAT